MPEQPKKSKRGGARPGAGAKKKLPPAALEAKLDGRTVAGRSTAGAVLRQVKSEKLWVSIVELECDRLGIDPKTAQRIPIVKDKDGKVIDGPDYQGNFSIIPLTNVLRYLEDRHHGRPVDTVNHIHKEPLEVHATLSLGEGMRLAMEKGEKRVSSRGRD